MSPGTEQRKLAAIMFTDMVGYSALAQRNEALALELLEEHRRVVRGLLPRHGGREVKTTGDGFLLEFPSALAAVQGAVEIQSALHERNQVSPPERQLRIRIGIHVGDVVMRDGDIHGDGVNIAARIEPLAAAGGICVSEDVERQVRNKLPQMLTALGPAELKNIVLPVVVHRVTMPWETPSSSRREEAQTSGRKPGQSLVTSAATKLGWIAALLVLVVGIAWWLADQSGKATKQVTISPVVTNSTASPVVAPTAEQKSVAVLAFANLSDDQGSEYFSDGISEELLNVLSKIPGLKVTARTSSFHFKGKDTPIPEIAQQLNVAYVVEGSVRRAGDRVRITAKLINVADGFQVWSETFTREIKDIFAVQDEIAALIAQQLQLKLAGSAGPKQVVNPEAYRLALEGHHFWLQRTEEALARAEAAYRQALEHDPQFARAHAGLAEVWMIRGWYRSIGGIFPPDEDFARAKSEAQLASRLDPTLAEPHATLGALLYNERKFAESEQEFQEALRLNPNYSFAHHWRAHLLMTTGKLDVALEELDRAVQLDPLSFVTLLIDSMWLSFAGRYDEALALNDRALALGPEGFVPTRGERSLLLLKLGRKDEAVAAARMISNDVNRQPRWWSDASAIHVLHQAGLEQEAEDYATRFLATLPANSYLRSFVSVALGRNDEALAQLSQSGPPTSAVGSVFYTTLWDGVRQDPRFLPIIAKLGYAKEYQVARETRSRLSKMELKK